MSWGNKINDGLLPEINVKLRQVPTSTCIIDRHHLHCIRAMEDHYHGAGEGEGQILAIWICITVKCNVFRHRWVKKSLNKKRSVTSTDDVGVRIFPVLE